MKVKSQQGKAEEVSDVVLYRYMTWKAFKNTLDSWMLKATIASQTNDYFEYFPATSDDPGIDEYAKEFTRGNRVFFSFSSLMSNCAMWRHYTEQYNGVCMAFYFPKVLKPRRMLRKVSYQRERVLVGDVTSSEDAAEKLDVLLTTKDISWNFERETRLFYEAEDANETRGYAHPTKFRIESEFWEDNMTEEKIRNKGYIF